MRKFVTLLVLTVAFVASTPPFVVSAAYEPTAEERNYCSSGGFTTYGIYPVKYNGVSNLNIGYVQVMSKPSPSHAGDTRWCAFTRVGSEINNKARWVKIRIGSRDQGDTSNKITWYYSSHQTSRNGSRAVALTPGDDRCPVFEGKLLYKSKMYRRVLNGGFNCN